MISILFASIHYSCCWLEFHEESFLAENFFRVLLQFSNYRDFISSLILFFTKRHTAVLVKLYAASVICNRHVIISSPEKKNCVYPIFSSWNRLGPNTCWFIFRLTRKTEPPIVHYFARFFVEEKGRVGEIIWKTRWWKSVFVLFVLETLRLLRVL